jgi:hypothetical protein
MGLEREAGIVSKTDKTRPWRVRKEDHKIERPRLTQDEMYLSYYTYKWWLGEMRCGCPMCSDQQGRKERVRKERYEGRRQARDYEE